MISIYLHVPELFTVANLHEPVLIATFLESFPRPTAAPSGIKGLRK